MRAAPIAVTVLVCGALFAVGVFVTRSKPTSAQADARAAAETRELAEWLAHLERTADDESAALAAGGLERPRDPFRADVDEPGALTAGERPATSARAASSASEPPAPDPVTEWRTKAAWATNSMRLDSIVTGSVALATIDGNIVGVGDDVVADGVRFRVTEIGMRHAVLVAESHELGVTAETGNALRVRLDLYTLG